MIGLKKHDMKTILKAGAKARGLSVSEFRAEIQGNIDNIVNSQDPAVQERFKKYFGNKIPTPKNTFTQLQRKQSFKCLSCFLQSRSAG